MVCQVADEHACMHACMSSMRAYPGQVVHIAMPETEVHLQVGILWPSILDALRPDCQWQAAVAHIWYARSQTSMHACMHACMSSMRAYPGQVVHIAMPETEVHLQIGILWPSILDALRPDCQRQTQAHCPSCKRKQLSAQMVTDVYSLDMPARW